MILVEEDKRLYYVIHFIRVNVFLVFVKYNWVIPIKSYPNITMQHHQKSQLPGWTDDLPPAGPKGTDGEPKMPNPPRKNPGTPIRTTSPIRGDADSMLTSRRNSVTTMTKDDKRSSMLSSDAKERQGSAATDVTKKSQKEMTKAERRALQVGGIRVMSLLLISLGKAAS